MKSYKDKAFLFFLVGLLTVVNIQSFGQNTWSRKQDFGDSTNLVRGVARYGAVAFSINGKGYMGTGYGSNPNYRDDFWEYDPSTNTWSQKASFGGTARVFATGFSIGSKGYVGCGDDNNKNGNVFNGSKDFWEFDPAANTWTRKADFGGVPRRGAVGFSIGAKGYMGTGRINNSNIFKYRDFWEYDPSTDKWIQKEDVGGPVRAFAAAFSIGTKGYIGTGHDLTGFVKDFWEFDPTYIDPITQVNTGKWTKKANFGGEVKYGGLGLSIGSYGYIGTGNISSGYSKDFWEYKPSSDQWTEKDSIRGKRSFTAGFSIGNKGYVGTGQIYPSGNLKDFWEYTPTCTPPNAPIIGTITQPTCGTPSGSVVLSGLPSTGTWTVTLNYPGSNTLSGSGTTATINLLSAGINITTYTATVTDAAGCTSAPSAAFFINVNPNTTTLGNITGPTNVCSGTSGNIYSIEVVTGFSVYTWTVPTGWTITAGQGTSTATISIGSGDGIVSVSATNGCTTATSSTGNIKSSTAIPETPGPIAGSLVNCIGGTNDYSISAVSGANSYVWSIPGSGWYIYSGQGTTTASVRFDSGIGNLSVKAINGCGSSPSSITGPISLSNTLPTIVSNPSGKSTIVGASTSFTVSATNAAFYQWQENKGGNSTYINIVNDGTYSGATTNLLTITPPSDLMNNNRYQCIVTGNCSPSITSGNARLTVFSVLSWTGATNTNWDLTTNWSQPFIPNAYTNIIIANTSNKPVIGSSALCKNLTINSSAVLTIAAGKSLTVNGTLVNNAGIIGLVIKSDATGTGSLIHNASGVNATIERYVPGDWTSSNSGWHFISSPVVSQAISGFTTAGAYNGYDFYGWNEPANLWVNYLDGIFNTWNGGSNFNIGQGYMISYEANQTKSFTGNINVSSYAKNNLSRTNGGTNYSWHLLGNPYSSALIWNDGNWALLNVAGDAKIWNGAAKSYSDIAANGIIPSAQGFMISVNSAINSITIPSVSRTHNTAFYKSLIEPRILLVASEQNGNSFQESLILINPSATAGFDFEYDSRFLQGYAPQFYSLSGNEMLSTNSLPSLNSSDVIPFGFIKNQSEKFILELKETSGGQDVYLTDLQTDSIQNLSSIPIYSFTSSEGDDPERFILHFQNLLTSVQENNRQETFGISQRNGIISISTYQPIDAEIQISNMLGQVLLRGKSNKNPLTTLNANKLKNGVYVVSLQYDNSRLSKKMVIKK